MTWGISFPNMNIHYATIYWPWYSKVMNLEYVDSRFIRLIDGLGVVQTIINTMIYIDI